jgi:hypothetical protein
LPRRRTMSKFFVDCTVEYFSWCDCANSGHEKLLVFVLLLIFTNKFYLSGNNSVRWLHNFTWPRNVTEYQKNRTKHEHKKSNNFRFPILFPFRLLRKKRHFLLRQKKKLL